MNPYQNQQSIPMINLGLIFFSISEVCLILILFFGELTPVKSFFTKLMAILFPCIIVWIYNEKKKFLNQYSNQKHFYVNQMREAFRGSQIADSVRICWISNNIRISCGSEINSKHPHSSKQGKSFQILGDKNINIRISITRLIPDSKERILKKIIRN